MGLGFWIGCVGFSTEPSAFESLLIVVQPMRGEWQKELGLGWLFLGGEPPLLFCVNATFHSPNPACAVHFIFTNSEAHLPFTQLALPIR